MSRILAFFDTFEFPIKFCTLLNTKKTNTSGGGLEWVGGVSEDKISYSGRHTNEPANAPNERLESTWFRTVLEGFDEEAGPNKDLEG